MGRFGGGLGDDGRCWEDEERRKEGKVRKKTFILVRYDTFQHGVVVDTPQQNERETGLRKRKREPSGTKENAAELRSGSVHGQGVFISIVHNPWQFECPWQR